MAVLSETITKGMEKAKEVIKKVVETAQAMHASFQKVSSTLTETVGAFNPAAVMRFEGALADLTAVAGQILLPALEKMTEVVREVGKWFYNLDPGTKKLIATLAAAGAAVAALGSAMVVIGPIVATITAAFTALAPVIGPPAAALFVLTGGFGLLKKNATDAKGPLETLRNIFNSLQDAIKPVVDAVQKSVLPAIQKMMDAINTAGQGLGGRIAAGIAAMQPAFDSIGRSISGLADQFAKLLPSLVELGSAFLELVTSGIGPTIVVLAELATGSLALFIEMLKPTIAWVKLLVDSMTAWYQAIMDVAKALKLLPKGGPTGAPSKGRDKDPMGLAVRPASYVGIEELGAQAQLAAYSSGSAKNERQLLEEGNNARTKAEERTHQILLAMAEKMGAVAENTQSKDPAGALNAVKGK